MTKFMLVRCLTGLLTCLAGAAAAGRDWEVELAHSDNAAHHFQRILDWSVGKDIRGDAAIRQQFRGMMDAFRKENPGSFEAARGETYFFDDPREPEAHIAFLADFLSRYPHCVSLHRGALERLAAMCRKGRIEHPDTVKLAAFRALVPYLRHQGHYLASTANFIGNLNLEGLPADMQVSGPAEAVRYSLARRVAEACGADPASRSYLAEFLVAFARSSAAKTPDVLAACRDFLAVYGSDHAESRLVNRLMLERLIAGGDRGAQAELNGLLEQDAADEKRLQAVFQAAAAAVAKGDMAAAAALLDAADLAPAYAAAKHWWALLGAVRQVAKHADADALVDVLALAVRHGTAGVAEEAVGLLPNHPRWLEVVSRYLENHAYDVRATVFRTDEVLKYISANQSDPASKVAAYRAAAAALGRLGVADREVEVLFLAGRELWQSDRAAAERMLARAVEIAPNARASIRAGWFLAFLRGELGLTQPPLAKIRIVDRPAAAALPPLPRVPVPPAGDDDVDAMSLPRRSDDVDLAAGQTPVTLQNPATARHAVDQDPATAWLPETLPAALTVPLARPATVARVKLRTTDRAHCVVSLLAADGRVLARTTRDWDFPNAQHLPPNELVLRFLPVDEVAWIRFEFTGSGPTGIGLSDLAVSEAPYPMVAERLGSPVPLPNGVHALRAEFDVDEPELRVTYGAGHESARGFVTSRWLVPWVVKDGPLSLGQANGNLGLEFFGGENAELTSGGAGVLEWSIHGQGSGRIERVDPAKTSVRLADELPPGRHFLWLTGKALPAVSDRWSPNDAQFVHLAVTGRSRASVGIRFGDGTTWGEWTALPATGRSVEIPKTVTHYQLKRVYDNRSTLGQACASFRHLAVEDAKATPGVPEADTKTGSASTGAAGGAADPNQRQFITEALEEAAQLVTGRRVVVTYPRAGTRAEFEAAKAIADRAGLYLVSDDHALNNYPGLPLVVGRPLRHRYARNVVAMAGIWGDPHYLNASEGLVSVVRRRDGSPWFVVAIGETVEAVAAAAARLNGRVQPHAPGEERFRLFPADTLEVVHAWQLHPDRPRLEELRLRLARNDRRSLQFGMAAERELTDLRLELGELRRTDGTPLAAETEVRTSGFYEWEPFFGDLRLPNQLLPEPYLPMPANTACGAWVTVHTDRNAAPGLYSGELSVTSGSHTRKVRVQVEVEPVTLPDFGPTAFFSFTYTPWWFAEDSPEHDRARRELARNEARHGVNWVSAMGGKTGFPHRITTLPETGEPQAAIDAEAWEQSLSRIESEYAALGLEPPGFIAQTGPSSHAHELAESLLAFLRNTGREQRFLLKVGDEPGSFTAWTEWARPYREGGLRVFTCGGPAKDAAATAGVMDPHCPNYQHDVLARFYRERQEQGEQVWWYMCGEPPTRLTGQPADNLAFYWLTAKWNFTGGMSYGGHCLSPHSVETSPVPFRYDHGLSHRVMFLPDGSILDTHRRELESDGIRDNMLIEFIKARLNAIRGGKEPAESRARLQAILEEVVPYKYGYSQSPEAWQAARNRLYDLAVQAAGQN